MGTGVNERGLSRRHIRLAVEGSLRRLGTDRLDLYFVHGFDELTAMEETLPRPGRPGACREDPPSGGE